MYIKTQHRAILATLILLLAAGPAMATGTRKAAATGVVEEITVTPARIVIPQEWQVLSRASARILRHIADARGAIAVHNPAEALKDLDKIDRNVAIIKEGRPVAVIEDHISIARKHLEYEKTTEVAADLIPIASDLTYLEDVIPTAKAKKHLAAAREHLKKGEKQAAKKELAALDEAVGFSEVDLPLAETVRQVDLARKYLKENKLKAADKALKTAENNVVILSVGVEQPVARARHSLERAKKHHAANKDAAARADLVNAMAWIDRAKQSGDSKVRASAAELAKEVRQLAAKLK
ncbi:MAG TPA: YfdX family protein [Desulfobulbus sp.]|nr:YfdX family protein [Desulfobulbus sp.]